MSRYMRILSLALFLVTPSLFSQSATSPTPPAIDRDSNAVLMLRQSLDALGGEAQWSQINCVLIDGTATVSSSSTSSPIRVKYCWKNLTLQSRHEFLSGTKKIIRYSDPTKGSSISTNGTLEDISSKARVSTLPDRFPPAVFLIALGDPKYSITLLSPTLREPHPGVKIIQYEQGHPVPPSEQDWYFSDTTSLPDHVVVYLRDNLHPGRRLQSRLRFESFMNDGPVKVPSSLEEVPYFGTVRQIVLQSVVLNPASAPSDFDPSAEGSKQ